MEYGLAFVALVVVPVVLLLAVSIWIGRWNMRWFMDDEIVAKIKSGQLDGSLSKVMTSTGYLLADTNRDDVWELWYEGRCVGRFSGVQLTGVPPNERTKPEPVAVPARSDQQAEPTGL